MFNLKKKQRQKPIVRDLKILVPLFTEKSIEIVNQQLSLAKTQKSLDNMSKDLVTCPQCLEFYDFCFCDDLYESSSVPTANYRGVISFKNVLYARHIQHKTTMKQLLNKMRVVPQSIAELFCGVNEGHFQAIANDTRAGISEFRTLAPKVDKTLDEVEEMLSHINSKMPELGVTMGAFNSTLDKLSGASEAINSGSEKVGNYKDFALGSIVLSTALYWSFDMTDLKRIGALICTLLAFKFLATTSFMDRMKTLITGVVEYVYEIYNRIFDKDTTGTDEGPLVVPQIGVEELDTFSGLISTGIAAASASKLDTFTTGTITKILADTSRSKRGLEDCLKAILKCFEAIANFVRRKCFSLPNMRLFDSSSTEIDDFLDELSEFHNSDVNGTLPKTVTTYNRIIDFIKRGKVIVKNIPRDKNSEGFLRLVNIEMKYLNDMFVVFKNLNFTKQGIRQEPVGIIFQGGAGVGKSITVMHLSNALCAALLPDDEYSEFLASASTKISIHTPETKFWDGYKQGSLITVIDDFGQAVDIPGVPDNEYLKVIRAVNSYEYIMHMAKLEEKGTTFFDSKFFLCTTNLVKFDSKSIVSNEALNRRFPVRYIISILPEFCTDETAHLDHYHRKIDPKKLPIRTHKGKNYGSLCPSVQIFVPSDNNGLPCGPPINFDEFVEVCINEHNKRQKWQETQDVEFVETRDRYRSSRTPSLDQDIFFDAEDTIVPQSGDFWKHSEDIAGTAYDSECPSKVDSNFMDNEYMKSLLEEYSPAYVKTAVSLLDEKRDREMLFNAKKRHGFVYDGPLLIFHIKLLQYYNKGWISAVRSRQCDKFLTDFVVNNPVLDFEWKAHKVFQPEGIRKKFDELSKTIHNKVRDSHPILEFVLEFVKQMPWYVMILSLVAVAIGLLNAHKFYKILFGLLGKVYDTVTSVFTSFFKKDGELTEESLSKPTMHTPKMGSARYIVDQKEAKGLVTPQSMTDLDKSGYDLMTSVLKKSWYKIEMEHKPDCNEFKLLGACLAVKGRVVLMPYHFIRKFIDGVRSVPENQNAKLRMYKDLGGIRNSVYTFTVGDFIRGHEVGDLVHNDLVLVELPDTFQLGADRTKNFALRSDFSSHITNIPFTMRTPQTESDVVFGDFATAVDNTVVTSKDLGCKYEIRKGYRYRGFTNGGDCGAIMVVLDNKQPTRKIFGMHVAGVSDKYVTNGYSYSASVCQEDLLNDLKAFRFSPCKEESIVVEESDIQFGNGRFATIGALKKSPNAVLVTSLRKSKLYGIHGEVDMEPSLLRPMVNEEGVTIDPFEVALSKYCINSSLDYDSNVMSKAWNDYYIKIMNMPHHVSPRVLDLRAVLDGNDISGQLESITSSTSAGYPMNLTGADNLKKNYYSSVIGSPEREIAFKAIEEKVQEFVSKLNEFIVPEVIYTDNLKDERRPRAKVQSGSTRLFSGSPFIFLLTVKMYFGDFSLQYQENRIDNESAIGVNPYSNEWDRIARSLNVFGDGKNKGAGDYTAYDGSHSPVIQLLILDLINEWYDTFQDDHIRRGLFTCITHSVHVYRGIVYEWVGGMPSGNPLTTLLNCMYNSLAFRYCWYRQDYNRPIFDSKVKLLVMGDDNLFSVHHDYHDFNELTLPDLMKEIGLKYTPEDKTALLETPFRSLEDIEFLKRSFVFEPLVSSYIAPLRFSVIKEMIEWTKKGSESDKITVENVVTALCEASLHGKERYDAYSKLVIPLVKGHFPTMEPSKPWIVPHADRMYGVLNSRTFFL